jgi:hypothetical protein
MSPDFELSRYGEEDDDDDYEEEVELEKLCYNCYTQTRILDKVFDFMEETETEQKKVYKYCSLLDLDGAYLCDGASNHTVQLSFQGGKKEEYVLCMRSYYNARKLPWWRNEK